MDHTDDTLFAAVSALGAVTDPEIPDSFTVELRADQARALYQELPGTMRLAAVAWLYSKAAEEYAASLGDE